MARDHGGPSRFTPLVAFIAAQEGDHVTLSFTQIEAIIGVPLSVSSQVSDSVWSHPQHRPVPDLAAIGWRAHLLVHEHAVEFRRLPIMHEEGRVHGVGEQSPRIGRRRRHADDPTVSIRVTMPGSLRTAMDTVVRARGATRSGLIALAVREWLEREAQRESPETYARR